MTFEALKRSGADISNVFTFWSEVDKCEKVVTDKAYYLYIVPQTGKVYTCDGINEKLAIRLCSQYGRIFAISGYSKTAKIITLKEDMYGNGFGPEASEIELHLDADMRLWDNTDKEILPENYEIQKF